MRYTPRCHALRARVVELGPQPELRRREALFLAPLMSIHYAHLVMLAERGIVSTDDAQAMRAGARLRLAAPMSAARLRRHLRGSVLLRRSSSAEACGEDVAGRLHTARSRNDIDMTMYRMRQRELILGSDRRHASSCGKSLLDSPGRHRDTVFAAHTHTQRAQPTTVAHYLLAGDRAARARRGPSAGAPTSRTNRNPLGPAPSRARGSPSIGTSPPTSSASPARRATPTAASRRSTTCSRAWRRPGCWWSGSGASRRICCCGRRWSSTICGSGTASCSAAASCRRSGTRSRSSTRAPSAARRWAERRRSSQACTTRRSATSSIPRTICSRWSFAMFRDATRAVTLMAAAMATAEFDPRRLEARAGAGWTTLTELADALVRDHGVPFGTAHGLSRDWCRLNGAGCRDRISRERRERRGAAPACRAPRRGVCRDAGIAAELLGGGARRDSEPRAFCPRPEDAGRARARRNRAGRVALARRARGRSVLVDEHDTRLDASPNVASGERAAAL